MPDPASLINTPLGEKGSGRVRYGAAMALYAAGRIGPEVLEVFRVASAHDARDPRVMLQDRGLPPLPELEMPTPLAALYQAARDYVLTLDHPGAPDVRASLPEDPGPERAVALRRNAVVDQWLAPALDLAQQTQPVLAGALARAAGQLNWITYDLYPRDEIGEGFATGHAYASIRGEDSPFTAKDVDLGVFLIRPGVLYRDHRHAAPELYAPLTGPHGWRFGPGTPFQVKPAHQPVWNPSNQPHMTKVGQVPFLCLFVWTRDVNEAAVVIPAGDWAELEAMTLA